MHEYGHICAGLAGQSGWSPAAFAGACFESTLPPHADIVIVETRAAIDALALERFIWRILRHFRAQQRRPAIVIYNPFHVGLASAACTPPGAHLRQCCSRFNSSFLRSWSASPGRSAGGGVASSEEVRESLHHDLARFYGFASLSHRDFLWQFIKAEAWHALNFTHGECELVNRVNVDSIHPSVLGQLLLADYFWAYLGGAMRRTGKTGVDWAAMPKRSFQPTGRDVYQMRCYGFLGSEGKEVLAPTSGAGIGDFELDVVGGEGFQFFLNTIDGPVKRKPGWVATRPGAFVDMAVNTLFRTSPAGQRTLSDVVVSFLKSYEHMGQADLSCVSGCECQATTVDAHHTDRISVTVTATLKVTSTERCVLRVLVRNETSSGNFKFKIVSLMARMLDSD